MRAVPDARWAANGEIQNVLLSAKAQRDLAYCARPYEEGSPTLWPGSVNMVTQMSFDLPSVPTKTHRDENFPVASRLIAPRHRPAILAFYHFVRAADDIADDPKLTSEQKLAGLDRFEAALTGKADDVDSARPLRAILAERGLSPRHALDLLHAFRMDAVKNRYENFDELMHYCAYSAAPVGRFVLDVHGESERTWLASDALCSALQIINHLQDCGADYRKLDRVYVPLDALSEAGADVKALGAEKASPALLAACTRLLPAPMIWCRSAKNFRAWSRICASVSRRR